jgi:hypothetical protein
LEGFGILLGNFDLCIVHSMFFYPAAGKVNRGKVSHGKTTRARSLAPPPRAERKTADEAWPFQGTLFSGLQKRDSIAWEPNF